MCGLTFYLVTDFALDDEILHSLYNVLNYVIIKLVILDLVSY